MRHREEPKRCHKGVNPEWELWYRMAIQARKSKKLHHKVVMKLRRKQEQGGLAKCDLRPLGRHARSVKNRASGLARNDLRPLGRLQQPQEQSLLVWAWNIQEQQAVVR